MYGALKKDADARKAKNGGNNGPKVRKGSLGMNTATGDLDSLKEGSQFKARKSIFSQNTNLSKFAGSNEQISKPEIKKSLFNKAAANKVPAQDIIGNINPMTNLSMIFDCKEPTVSSPSPLGRSSKYSNRPHTNKLPEFEEDIASPLKSQNLETSKAPSATKKKLTSHLVTNERRRRSKEKASHDSDSSVSNVDEDILLSAKARDEGLIIKLTEQTSYPTYQSKDVQSYCDIANRTLLPPTRPLPRKKSQG